MSTNNKFVEKRKMDIKNSNLDIILKRFGYDYDKSYDCNNWKQSIQYRKTSSTGGAPSSCNLPLQGQNDEDEDITCNHFTKLMFLMINVYNIPNGFSILKNYVLAFPDEIDKKNTNQWTALHIAIRNSEKFSNKKGLEIIQILLENGADVNLPDNFGWTPLMFAVEYSNLEIVRLLLNKNADVNSINKDGLTVLMIAAQKSSKECNPTSVYLEAIKILLKKGDYVNVINKENKTFYDYMPRKYIQEHLNI